MIPYPTTYYEMGTWISMNKFRDYFVISDEDEEKLYDSLKTHQILKISGNPADGNLSAAYKDGTLESVPIFSCKADPTMYAAITVTEAGLTTSYTAEYLAAHRSVSSGGSSYSGSAPTITTIITITIIITITEPGS